MDGCSFWLRLGWPRCEKNRGGAVTARFLGRALMVKSRSLRPSSVDFPLVFRSNEGRKVRHGGPLETPMPGVLCLYCCC